MQKVFHNSSPQIHKQHSMRLPGYDYTKPGQYYVTIVTKQRKHVFGKIENGMMKMNDFGHLIKRSWEWLEIQYKYVELDEFIIMPNHLHGIIIIRDGRGVSRNASTTEIDVKRKSLGRLIGAFKTVSTKQINLLQKTPGKKIWQRDFHDQIIRGDEDLVRIRRYIKNNPKRWGENVE